MRRALLLLAFLPFLSADYQTCLTNCAYGCLQYQDPAAAQQCALDCVNVQCRPYAYCMEQTECQQCADAPAYNCVWTGTGCELCTQATCISDCRTGPAVTPTRQYTVTPTPVASCGQFSSCSTCTVQNGCGWSASQAVCKSGVASGSGDGSSSGSDWKWTSTQCAGAPTPVFSPSYSPAVANCIEMATCENCVRFDGCGWGYAQGKCLYGVRNGSIDGSSYGQDWIWTNGNCPSQCSAHPTCSNCTGYAHCGWSRNQSECMFGSSGGAVSGASYGNDWVWRTNECPDAVSPTPLASPTYSSASSPTMQCASHYTCESCAAEDGCGWSKARDSCLRGSQSGSSDGASSGSDWVWRTNGCPSASPTPTGGRPGLPCIGVIVTGLFLMAGTSYARFRK